MPTLEQENHNVLVGNAGLFWKWRYEKR